MNFLLSIVMQISLIITYRRASNEHSLELANVRLRSNVMIFHSPSLNLIFFSRGLGI